MKIWRFLIVFLFLFPMSVAFGMMEGIDPATMTAIAFVVSVLVGLFGPRPIEWLILRLKLEGQWAVLFVYLVSFLVGTGGLLLSKEILGITFIWENALALAGLIFAASTYAFHRLKDLNRI